VELIRPLPLSLHGMVLNYLSTGGNFTFSLASGGLSSNRNLRSNHVKMPGVSRPLIECLKNKVEEMTEIYYTLAVQIKIF
jgi:hypothetical protein